MHVSNHSLGQSVSTLSLIVFTRAAPLFACYARNASLELGWEDRAVGASSSVMNSARTWVRDSPRTPPGHRRRPPHAGRVRRLAGQGEGRRRAALGGGTPGNGADADLDGPCGRNRARVHPAGVAHWQQLNQIARWASGFRIANHGEESSKLNQDYAICFSSLLSAIRSRLGKTAGFVESIGGSPAGRQTTGCRRVGDGFRT